MAMQMIWGRKMSPTSSVRREDLDACRGASVERIRLLRSAVTRRQPLAANCSFNVFAVIVLGVTDVKSTRTQLRPERFAT